MAMNVKFLKGVKKSLPTTRDSNTLYFVTDEGALYLGATLIGANFTSAIEAANAAIKGIKDHGYVNSTEVGTAIGTALESYYTKSQIDSKIGTLKIGDTSYDSVVDYVVAKTTGIATDAVVAEKADKIKPTKSDVIAILDYNTGNLKDSKTTITDVIQTALTNTLHRIDTLNAEKSSAAVEEGKGIQVTVKEAAGKLTEVSVSGNYDNKYDALGAAAAVLGNSNDAATANTVYGAKAAAAAAQSDATVAKTKIETFLGTITPDGSQDIIDTLAEINSYVGEHGEEFAALSERVTKVENGTTVVAKANADKDGNEFSATYAKTADISEDIAKGVDAQGRVATLEGKVDVAKVSTAISKATEDMATNSSVNTKLADYTKTEDLGDLASKDKVAISDLASDASTALSNGTQAYTTLTNGSITIAPVASDSNKITITAFGKTSNDFTVPYAIIAGSAATANRAIVADDAEDSAKLGGKAPSYYEVAGTAAALVGSQQAGNNAATGVYAAIQGATTNTVKDCVDAINTMNGQVGSTIGTVENIVSQLTWGSF